MKENKLFNQIKAAAENDANTDFSGMEKVWQRVEEKLDNKQDKKAVEHWKKIAVAASLLLFGTLGYQFFINNPNTIKSNQTITVNDTIKNRTQDTSEVGNAVPLNPAIKKEAEEILNQQIKPETQVALASSTVQKDLKKIDEFKEDDAVIQTETHPFGSSDGISKTGQGILNTNTATNLGYLKSSLKYNSESKDVELFMDKSGKTQTIRKEEPLVMIDEKVSKIGLREVEFNEADSLIVLNEPLYIINGTEFTEQQVFGPNPTSPYTPLNKQEIETISVLQHEKAFEIYGKKGEKGVVIITTKNGKPVTASKKTK